MRNFIDDTQLAAFCKCTRKSLSENRIYPLGSVLHCLRHYAEDDERRYSLDCDGEAVPFEYTTACLLGDDSRRFHDAPLAAAVSRVLDQFDNANAPIVGMVAREEAGFVIDDEARRDVFDLFRWFRAGAGI